MVSGDLIRGAPIGHPTPDDEIAAQYCEAGDFLRRLADEIVDSDRSRVVIVPGNHDVDWSRARNAMESLETCPDGIEREAFQAVSGVRWNWRDQKAYQIVDSDKYASRFDHFREFQRDFYAGLVPSPVAHADCDLIFVEYSSLGLAVVGFASWHGNDCFCQVGEIDSTSLALSQKLLEEANVPVAVAVWHHSIEGGPHTRDYMDRLVIHRLIDLGFRVGLHGHQHRPGAAPYELRLPNLTSMVVIGAGSLAVGDSELPVGERRQFNVVVIDQANELVTVHVRAMSSGGIFSGSHRDDFGGKTSIDLSLPRLPASRKPATALQQLDEAMTAIVEERHEKALGLLPQIDTAYSRQKRQIEIEALDGLGRLKELVDILDPPQSVDEVVRLIALLLDAGRFAEAEACLEAGSALVDPALFRELSNRIAVRRITS